MVTIRMVREDGFDPSIPLPTYQTDGAAAADICANFPDRKTRKVKAGHRVMIPTGFLVEIPPGYEIQVRPRSGLARHHGITFVNSPGTIDSDYRGSIGIILFNTGKKTYKVKHGDRIGQLVVAPVIQARFESVTELSGTVRGAGGYGSTGG